MEVTYCECRSQWPRGLRRRSMPLAYFDREFESLKGRGCLFVVYVVFYQVEVLAKSRSLVQRLVSSCVWSRNLVDEEAIARAGLQSQREREREKIIITTHCEWRSFIFHGNRELPQEDANCLLLKIFLENFKRFHPFLGDRSIIKIVILFIFLSVSSKFLWFTLP
jgi:hypothetical protein